jgi:hypothetical protein
MKAWPCVIGIFVILAVLGTPALAISKSELIASYKGQSIPTSSPTQSPASTCEEMGGTLSCPCFRDGVQVPCICGCIIPESPTPIPTSTPTPVPTQAPSKWPFPFISGAELPTKSQFIKDQMGGLGGNNYEKNYEKMEIFNDVGDNSSVNSYAADLPSKGKPNIYLYSDRDLIARVRLAPENAITVSEPVYQRGIGWQVEIRNGSLNGKGDFLFYEARGSDFPWQKEEGYVIRAAYREQDMAFMLGQYGFNEKETAEFIDYWASHLVGDMDFVFYPQETEAVNQDMPLYISPKPDHVMRIWFYAEPLRTTPEPVIYPEKIVREGLYVVEWGVIIDDEYWINHMPFLPEVV